MRSALHTAVTLPLLILAVLSLPFLFTDLDLRIQEPFYEASTQDWPTGKTAFWQFFYTIGPLPAIITGLAAAITLILGIGNPRLARYRKLSCYLFAVLAVGAGLVTNTLLKDQWGRPRPKQVTEFAGSEDFERLLHYEPVSEGKSFPCGHATVGFFFLAFVPILSGWRRWLALAVALALGLLIGMARITQGGHFTSDVLWAAAVMWFTSLAFYRLLRLNRALFWTPPTDAKAPPKWLPWVSGVALVAILVLGTTIWPYEKEFDLTPSNVVIASNLPYTLTLDYQGEDILEVQRGAQLSIITRTDGHRAPKSKLRNGVTLEGETITVTYERSGLFSELNVRTVVTLPENLTLNIRGTEALTTLILPPLGEPSPVVELMLAPRTEIQYRKPSATPRR